MVSLNAEVSPWCHALSSPQHGLFEVVDAAAKLVLCSVLLPSIQSSSSRACSASGTVLPQPLKIPETVQLYNCHVNAKKLPL